MIKKFKKWLKDVLYQNIIIVEDIKNSKITINNKVVYDDTKK